MVSVRHSDGKTLTLQEPLVKENPENSLAQTTDRSYLVFVTQGISKKHVILV